MYIVVQKDEEDNVIDVCGIFKHEENAKNCVIMLEDEHRYTPHGYFDYNEIKTDMEVL